MGNIIHPSRAVRYQEEDSTPAKDRRRRRGGGECLATSGRARRIISPEVVEMRLSGLFLIVHAAALAAAVPNHQTDSIETSQGTLKLMPLYHGSVMLDFGGKIIHVDPWSQADYAGVPQ